MSNTVDILIRTQAQLGALQSLAGTWLPRLITLGTAYKAIGLVKDQIDFADAMGKSAQKAGVLVDQFSALVHVAEQSDLSADALTQSFKYLNEWMEKTGRATEDNVEVLLETAELFERMPDGVQKTNLAVEMFGRSGLNMIPMLNQGRDGITELMREAAELGRVVNRQTARAAEEFNDQLTKLQARSEGISLVIASSFLPVLNDLTRDLRVLASIGANDQGKGGWLEAIGLSLQINYKIAKELGKEFGKLVQGAGFDFDAAALRSLVDVYSRRYGGGDPANTKDPVAGVDGATNRTLHLRAIRSAQVGAEGEDLADQVRNEIANLEQAQGELRKQFTSIFVPDTGDTEYTAAFAKVAEDWYKLADEIVQAEQWLADRQREIREGTLENYAAGLAAFAEVARRGGREGFAAYKALAIGEATIATFLAATKELAAGDPYSKAFRMAGVIALGIANVATIASTSYGGAREYGGPVEAGKMYLTGERGPEFFVPDQRGAIIPAGLTERMRNAPAIMSGLSTGGAQPTEVKFNVGLINGRQDYLNFLRSGEGRRVVIDIIKGEKLEIGIPT